MRSFHRLVLVCVVSLWGACGSMSSGSDGGTGGTGGQAGGRAGSSGTGGAAGRGGGGQAGASAGGAGGGGAAGQASGGAAGQATGGSSGTAGAAGQGSGGTAGRGTGGTTGGNGGSGTGGQGGGSIDGGPSCTQLMTDYSNALPAALACNPSGSNQCTQQALLPNCTACSRTVNDATTLDAIRAQLIAEGCTHPLACPCAAPSTSTCVADDAGSSAGTCMVVTN